MDEWRSEGEGLFSNMPWSRCERVERRKRRRRRRSRRNKPPLRILYIRPVCPRVASELLDQSKTHPQNGALRSMLGDYGVGLVLMNADVFNQGVWRNLAKCRARWRIEMRRICERERESERGRERERKREREGEGEGEGERERERKRER